MLHNYYIIEGGKMYNISITSNSVIKHMRKVAFINRLSRIGIKCQNEIKKC
jgi:hypothetical protein